MDNQDDAKKAREVIHKSAENMVTFYTNSAFVTVSIYDLTVVFGQVEELSPEHVIVKEFARIIMSPQHAKALASILRTRVEEYEEHFGTLPTTGVLGGEEEIPISANEPEQPS